jgi:hypothetical protein
LGWGRGVGVVQAGPEICQSDANNIDITGKRETAPRV